MQSQLGLEERLKKGAQILNGWEQYYNKEEKIQSISEFVVLVYMVRHKAQLETFAHRRSEFKNFHRGIAEYLIGVWEENGWKDLMIWNMSNIFKWKILQMRRTKNWVRIAKGNFGFIRPAVSVRDAGKLE